MLTGAPPATDRAPLTPSPRRRVWPWAVGSMLLMLAFIAATLLGHRLAARDRLASQVAPAPALPPLSVQAITRAPGQITQLALDAGAHTLVAQIAAVNCQPPLTPYPSRCAVVGTPQVGVAFYDSQTGALRNQQLAPDAGDDAGPFALTDATQGVTYLLDASGVTTYSDATGAPTGHYARASASGVQAAALDEPLGLIYTLNSQGDLSAISVSDWLTIATGTVEPTVAAPLPASTLMVDPGAGRVYYYQEGAASTPGTLLAFDASSLSPLGSWSVPAGWQSGPLDPASHLLFFSGASQGIAQLDLTTLPATGAGQTLKPLHDSILPGASRFGFDHTSGAALVMNSAGVEAYATGATQPYAAVPLLQAPTTIIGQPSPWLLPVDGSAGLAYLPGDDNTILIVKTAQPRSHAAPNALTAAVMARAGLASLLPDTNQNPPFLSAQTFPLDAGKVSREYYIHYSDLGWKGPYAGTASLSDVKAGPTAGEYTMTFGVTWNQLFAHQHSWTVQITPDGRTHLLADSGDGIP